MEQGDDVVLPLQARHVGRVLLGLDVQDEAPPIPLDRRRDVLQPARVDRRTLAAARGEEAVEDGQGGNRG